MSSLYGWLPVIFANLNIIFVYFALRTALPMCFPFLLAFQTFIILNFYFYLDIMVFFSFPTNFERLSFVLLDFRSLRSGGAELGLSLAGVRLRVLSGGSASPAELAVLH